MSTPTCGGVFARVADRHHGPGSVVRECDTRDRGEVVEPGIREGAEVGHAGAVEDVDTGSGEEGVVPHHHVRAGGRDPAVLVTGSALSVLPDRPADRSGEDFIGWHNEKVYWG
jgi:hypothetical protein